MSRDWRVAKSLLHLRDQVDAAVPNRSKFNDGTIGDERHQRESTSDHNPYIIDDKGMGVVRAIDISHDPKNGCDSYVLAETLRKGKDSRIRYIISNRKIASPSINAWAWRPYHGTNPHDCHVHVSVSESQRLYDGMANWDIGVLKPKTTAPLVVEYPLLKVGSTGDDVVALQKLLHYDKDDGVFDDDLEVAVRSFQSERGLTVDGDVGTYTWRELHKGVVARAFTDETFVGITATVFGGGKDIERSAYDRHKITDDELAVALPARFSGKTRPRVEVTNQANGRRVVCTIEDVGPWNEGDAYWAQTGGRPQAESGKDNRGRKTNKAGIDLSPAAANQIKLNGKGKVNWRFV